MSDPPAPAPQVPQTPVERPAATVRRMLPSTATRFRMLELTPRPIAASALSMTPPSPATRMGQQHAGDSPNSSPITAATARSFSETLLVFGERRGNGGGAAIATDTAAEDRGPAGEWVSATILQRLFELSERKAREWVATASASFAQTQQQHHHHHQAHFPMATSPPPPHPSLLPAPSHQLREFFSPQREPAFHSLLDAVKAVSAPAASAAVVAALSWRAAMLVLVAQELPVANAQNATATAADGDAASTLQTNTSTEAALFEAAIEYVAVTVMNVAVEDTRALDDVAFNSLAEVAFAFVSRPLRAVHPAAVACYTANIKHIRDLYGYLLGVTGTSKRLGVVSAKYMALMSSLLASGASQPLMSLLSSMRFLRIRVTSKRSTHATTELLTQYFHQLSRINLRDWEKPVRISLMDTLAMLLWKLAPSVLALSKTGITELVVQIWEWARHINKSKLCGPLMIGLLCTGGRGFFQRNWWSNFAEPLLRSRDRKMRALGMDAVPILIDIYLSNYAESGDVVFVYLQSITSYVFPVGKRLIVAPKDSLDRFVDLICCIAKSKLVSVLPYPCL